MNAPDGQKYLDFCYRVPFGLLEIGEDGAIHLINASATNLILPLTGGLFPSNAFDALGSMLPIREAVEGTADVGVLVEEHRYTQQVGEWSVRLAFRVERIRAGVVMVVVRDIASDVLKEAERLATSRRVGMADVANELAHEVGNQLNSVRVDLNEIGAGVRGFESARLERVAGGLESGQLEPSKVAVYLRGLEARNAEEVRQLQGRLRAVESALDALAKLVVEHQDTETAAPTSSGDVAAVVRRLADVHDLQVGELPTRLADLDQVGFELALDQLFEAVRGNATVSLCNHDGEGPALCIVTNAPVETDCIGHGGALHTVANRLRTVGANLEVRTDQMGFEIPIPVHGG